MKRILILFIILFTCLVNVNVLYASCQEETEYAQGIMINKLNMFDENGTYIVFEIYGLVENNYIIVTNDFNDDVLTVRFSDLDEDGVYKFNAASVTKSINYTFKVYGNTCGESVLNSSSIKTDKYNPYAINSICDGYWADIEYCGGFYDIKDMDEEEFLSKVQEEIEKLKPKSFIYYVKTYYLYFIIPIIIGSIIFIIRVIIYKKGDRK